MIKIKNVSPNCCLKTNILYVFHFPEDEHSSCHFWKIPFVMSERALITLQYFGSALPGELKVKRETTRGSNMRPFNENSRPGWTLANILSFPEVLASFHCGQQCSSQGLWSRLHWSHHLTLVHVTFLHSGPRFPLLPSDSVLEGLMDWFGLWSFCHSYDQSNPGHCDLSLAAMSWSVLHFWPIGEGLLRRVSRIKFVCTACSGDVCKYKYNGRTKKNILPNQNDTF